MNNYLIPANSKKGQLLFGIFRPIDLAVVVVGAFVTILFMFLIPGDSLPILLLKLLPLAVSILLVMPIPYYHNVLVFIQEFVIFIIEQKEFHWRGWCVRDELIREDKQTAKYK